jgi:hypothetical protein
MKGISNMEFKKISNYDIHIRHTVNGGVIAKLGCVELSFSSSEDMMIAMGQFYADPEGMEKEYNSVVGPQEVESGDPCREDRGSTSTGPMVSGGNRLSRGPLNVEATEESLDRRR